MGTLTLDQQILLFENIVEGIDKHITTDVRLGGLVYPPQALKAVFTDAVSAIMKTRELDEEYRVSVAKQHAAQEQAMAVELLLRDNLVSAYGDEAFDVLGSFGMTPPKPKGAQTVAAKAAGIAARALTREARHTMGSQQEKKVTGLVGVPFNSPVLTTPSGGSTAAPAATPAGTQKEAKA